MTTKILITMAVVATLLAGCGQEAAKGPAKPISAAPAPAATVAQSPEPARQMGDKSKPLAEYVELNSGRQLLAHFVALHKMSADDWSRAATSNSKIANEQDAFKRQDMAKQFQAAAETEAAAVNGKQYVYFDLPDLVPRYGPSSHLGEYDFNQKGFPVQFFAGTRTRDAMSGQYRADHSKLGFLDDRFASLDFDNGDQFALFKVQDEALARTIEAGRSKGKLIDGVMYRPDLRVRAFVFVNGTSYSPMGALVTSQVMKIQLRDPQGNVVAEL